MTLTNSKKPLVLIVDDQPNNLKVLSDLLVEYGFDIMIARDGESTLQRLDRVIPDLILLDVLMPGIDGFDTCRRLKSMSNTQDIPIIFMTALSDPVDKIKGLTLGAVDYITKPFQQEEVIARINTHLQISQLRQQLLDQNSQLRQEVLSRQLAELALTRSEEKFSKAFRSNPGPMVLISLPHDRLVETNQMFCNITGYDLSEVMGKTTTQLSLWVDPMQWQDLLVTLQAQGMVHRREIEIYDRHRQVRILLISAELLDLGMEPHVLAMTYDITSCKQAANELLASQEQFRRQAELNRLLASLIQRIRESINLDEILSSAAREVCQALNANRVVIYRQNTSLTDPPAPCQILLEAVSEPRWSLLQSTSSSPTCLDEPSGWLYRGLIRLETLNSSLVPPALLNHLHQIQVQSALIVPILPQNRFWGCLMVHQCVEPHTWQPWEEELLSQLAIPLAIGIEQAELYQNLEGEVQHRTAELQQALQQEALLHRIVEKVRSSLDEGQMLQTVVDELGQGLNTLSCDVGLYNFDLKESLITHEFLAPGSSLRSLLGERISRHHDARYENQLLNGQTLHYCSLQPNYRIPGHQEILLSPLMDDHTFLGELCLYRNVEDGFTLSELRLLKQVAAQCVIAIRQARLYRASQQQVTELARLNRLQEDFVATVSHELRTPLTSLQMALHMMDRAASEEKRRQYYDMAVAQCKQEISLINDLLDLQRLEANAYTTGRETLVLPDWLASMIHPFRIQAEQQKLELETDIPLDLGTISTDPIGLERILRELLTNACKYTPPAGRIRVQVRRWEQQFLLTVANTADLADEEIPRLFTRFYRVTGADRWKHGGTGLGLALVKELVSSLGGDIQVHNRDGWVAFQVQLPIPTD